MSKNQTTAEITIIYPQRPGYIMKAHTLRQEFVARFGLSVLLAEGIDKCFRVVINGTNIYSQPIEENIHIDHEKIFNALGKYGIPLVLKPEVSSEPDDEADPDHLRWMNSVCSGE